jgi:hypothetical protein
MINKLIEIEMIIKKTSLLGKSWENLEGCMVKKENKKIKKNGGFMVRTMHLLIQGKSTTTTIHIC